MSTLWIELPRESRCARKANPSAEWTDAEQLLWSIEHSLRVLVWRQVSKDGQKGRNMPEPLQRPYERARNLQRAERALANRKDIDRILGIGGE